MRVIVCGGREFIDRQAVYAVLSGFEPGTTVIHGDQRGADHLADSVARELGLEVEKFRANWKRYGKAAGPMRNRQMLDTGAAMVVAFRGGKGTANMCRQAEDRGLPIREIA